MYELLESTFPSVLGGSYNKQCVLVTEHNTDASFVISYLLSFSLKNQLNVCFVCLSQSYGHYRNVANKIGTNLNDYVNNKSLRVLHALTDIGSMFCDEPGTTGDTMWTDIMTTGDLKGLYMEIRDVTRSFSEPFVVCFDDISILLNLGIDYKHVIAFCHQMRQLCCCSGPTITDGSFITLLHLPASNDDDDDETDINLLCQHLTQRSDVSITCSGLTTGICKEVHGQVVYNIIIPNNDEFPSQSHVIMYAFK